MAGIESIYFVLIYIDTDYLVANIGKTGPGDKANITASNNSYIQTG